MCVCVCPASPCSFEKNVNFLNNDDPSRRKSAFTVALCLSTTLDYDLTDVHMRHSSFKQTVSTCAAAGTRLALMTSFVDSGAEVCVCVSAVVVLWLLLWLLCVCDVVRGVCVMCDIVVLCCCPESSARAQENRYV